MAASSSDVFAESVASGQMTEQASMASDSQAGSKKPAGKSKSKLSFLSRKRKEDKKPPKVPSKSVIKSNDRSSSALVE